MFDTERYQIETTVIRVDSTHHVTRYAVRDTLADQRVNAHLHTDRWSARATVDRLNHR